ncbi:MAG: hypothetical protein H0U27_02500, partial [Nitrosopumilus sp.]|nr:hypothetical protein [Nitrosopumilus sp.]
GAFPWYFIYFIHSCRYNPSVDFIIITDNAAPTNLPDNVKFINKSLDSINQIAAQKLGFPVAINNPYKLCDFKPAYGFLFPDIIKGYDFWGHGDIDLIYGNIRDFITREILKTYEIINSRHDYITGSFCLFRNVEEINTLFMHSEDYEKVFSSPNHYCFDECSFLWKELQNGASIFDYPDNVQSMTYVVKKAENERKLKAYFDFIIVEGIPGEVKWQKGKIIYKDVFEAMFYHLVLFKKLCKRPTMLNPIPDTFYFTPRKIRATQN